MLTYTIKLKSTAILLAMRAEDEAIMDVESCKTYGDKIYSNAVLNEYEWFPGSYSVDNSVLFLSEEIEWVKPEEN